MTARSQSGGLASTVIERPSISERLRSNRKLMSKKQPHGRHAWGMVERLL